MRGYVTIGFGLLAATTLVLAGCPSDETSSSTTSGDGGTAGNPATGGGGTGGTPDPNTPVDTGHNCDPATGALPTLALSPIIQGLSDRPLLVKSPRGDADRLFVVEQRGVIRVWQNGTLTEFLNISAKVGDQDEVNNETGLLGLAFHPGYMNAGNGRFFVHYSNTFGNTVIAEYRASSDPNVADPNPVTEPILAVTQPFGNHNGGSIEFSPIDFFLYIGLGDGGSGGDPGNRSQNLNEFLGKILRIDINTAPYVVPAGNMAGGLPELFSYGWRNPYRFSFDACSGDLYVGDVGQDAVEEISYEAASAGSGLNYGWRLMEGNQCFNPSSCDQTGLTLPVVSVPHFGAFCDSIVGGYVYRGNAIPALRGRYIYGDTCESYVRSFVQSGGAATDAIDLTAQLGPGGSIYSFGEDDNGELYVLAGNTVYQIVAQ